MSQIEHQSNSRSTSVLTPPNYPPKRHRLRQKSWLIRRSRLIYLKLLRLRGKPAVVAKGLAIGVFAGCFPFLGLQSFIGIILASIFRGSKVAAMAATWISNPLTYVPMFVFNYKIGKLLLGTEDTELLPSDINSFAAFKELGAMFAITLFAGCFVVGIILALITYFYSLALLERWRDHRHLKRKK